MPFTFQFGGFDPGAFGGGFNPGSFQGGASGPSPRPRRARKPRRAVGNAFSRTILNLAVTLVFGLAYFYLELPALNFHAEEFYVFIFLLCAVYCVCAVFTSGFQTDGGVKGYFGFVRKQCALPFLTAVVLIAALAVGAISSWVVLRAGSYSKLLSIQPGDFTAEVEEISYDQIPMLDADSASRLGTRKLGELADMVSQFEILPTYTQINYQGRPVRVTSLRYGDLIKWFTNRGDGLPAYIIIDMVSQEAEVVRLPEGMKYTVAEHFGRNLYRHLRFNYPTMMFDEPVFEIDEEGTPYWVCSRIVRTIGLFGGVDVKGAVLVNAVTGESEYHEQVPNWVDRLYSADIIIQQYDFYGMYHNGFLNSMFGQKDVTVTTEGYNYIALEDDVYMYTGVTSVTSDESNIGFILSNQRTKETHFYSIAGAEEYSAMASAQSQVQQMSYTATFPLLLNIAGQPTYFMALKGADGLVKMFAMVNVQQYDVVSTGSTVAECEASYRQTLAHRGLIAAGEQGPAAGEQQESEGIVAEIRSAVIGGDTHYYVRMEDSLGYLDFNTADVPLAVLLDVRDHIRYTYVLEGAEFPSHGIVPATGFEHIDWDD
ncbi:CvpA family protein [uncultured Oscillibacter sp.]|uniref:CvpA family protein n=1 Tax=uncultured Oscillibacter sp. TaxID=876091 RepID=UPI0025D8AF7C|nr:CvpA family protein [uncultured Oscillibacter sp.]